MHGRRRPESLYGSLKVWPHLQRQGITVARCTGGADHVEQTVGSGVTRAEQVRTTISDPAADRAPDLVNRQLRVWGPNELFFADVTYVPMGHRGVRLHRVRDRRLRRDDRRLGMLDQQNHSRPGSPTPGLATY